MSLLPWPKTPWFEIFSFDSLSTLELVINLSVPAPLIKSAPAVDSWMCLCREIYDDDAPNSLPLSPFLLSLNSRIWLREGQAITLYH